MQTQKSLIEEIYFLLRQPNSLQKQHSISTWLKNVEYSDWLDPLNQHVSLHHDLRGAVANLKGFSDLVETKIAALKDTHQDLKEVNTYTQYLKKGCDKALGKIDEVLSTSKPKKERIRAADITSFIKEIEDSLAFQIRERKITLAIKNDFQGETILFKQRLCSLLYNIIENAVKYHDATVEKSNIFLSVHQEKGKILFYIHDNGQGIAAKTVEQFNQSDLSQLPSHGLKIIKKTCQDLEGDIYLRSKKNDTHIYISLPIK